MCTIVSLHNANRLTYDMLVSKQNKTTIRWQSSCKLHQIELEKAVKNNKPDKVSDLLLSYNDALNRYMSSYDGWQSILDERNEKKVLILINNMLPEQLVIVIGQYCQAVETIRTKDMIKWLNAQYIKNLPIIDTIVTWYPLHVRVIIYALTKQSDLGEQPNRKYDTGDIICALENGEVEMTVKQRALQSHGKLLSIYNYCDKLGL